MVKIKKILILIFVLIANRICSQDIYQIGTSNVGIEPEKPVISLAMAGYASPWEGRFTLQWVNEWLLPSITAMTGLENHIYIVSNHNLLRTNPTKNTLEWLGNALNIRLLAGSNNTLFVVNNDWELLKGYVSEINIKWEKISNVSSSVKALVASGEKLYAAHENGSFWIADFTREEIDWIEIESLKLKNIISLAANEDRLYALTDEGIIFQSGNTICYEGIQKRNTNWVKAAYKNEITIKEDIRHIAFADNTIFGISKENFLYKGEHRSDGNLSARAVSIKKDENIVVIVGIDIISLPGRFLNEIKDEIYKLFTIPPSAVFINISHTHFAPVVQDWRPWKEYHRPDYVYLYSTIKNGILSAVTNAVKSTQPAELSFGRGETDIGYNRSLKGHPELYDNDVDVIKINYLKNKSEEYLFMAACHPVFSTAGKLHYTISANYPGVARKLVEERTGASNSIFLQGAAGDINPKDNGEYITGEKLANEVVSVLYKPMNKISGSISYFLDSILIPITPRTKEEILIFREQNQGKTKDMVAERNVNWSNMMLKYYEENRMPTSLPVYVHTINIGNWKLIGFSRETTSEYSIEVKKMWPDSLVSVAGFTNDVSSYLPTKKHIKKQNYEGYDSFYWYGVPNTFPVSVDSTIISFIRQQNR